jgi:hypothetical protein
MKNQAAPDGAECRASTVPNVPGGTVPGRAVCFYLRENRRNGGRPEEEDMKKASGKRFTAATPIAILALFVALGGTTYAATGGNFVLGQSNSADATTKLSSTSAIGPALAVTNSGGRPAASFTANAGVAPFAVSNSAKVAGLNADSLDGLDSTAFLRSTVPVGVTGAQGDGAVLAATNTTTGSLGNGLQGTSSASLASGVYGENNGGGFGIAGRTNSPSHGAVYGQNTGGGPALELHTSSAAAPMLVDSSRTVARLSADYLDGLDSSAFVQGKGTTFTKAVSMPLNSSQNLAPTLPSLLYMTFACHDQYAEVSVTSLNSLPVNVFWGSAYLSPSIDYEQLSAGQSSSWGGDRKDIVTLALQGTPGNRQTVVTATIAYAVRASDCHFQIQALTTQQ